MLAFFDTSAVVPLLLMEPHSEAAGQLWETTTGRYAWQWLRVEAEAALVRRRAPSVAWSHWRTLETTINWIEPQKGWQTSLRLFNRGIGLRAADAGHLYVMEQCQQSIPSLQLITFDLEMRDAAKARGLACLPGL